MAKRVLVFPMGLEPFPLKAGRSKDFADQVRVRLEQSKERLVRTWRKLSNKEPASDPFAAVPMAGPASPTPPAVLPAVGAIIAEAGDFDEDKAKAEGALLLDDREFSVPDVHASESNLRAHRAHLAIIGAGDYHRSGRSGTGVWIGILDSGIKPDHPEFAGRQIAQAGNPPFAQFGADGKIDSRIPGWTNFHGTQVAAFAGGSTFGVAPGAELAIGHVLTESRNGAAHGNAAQAVAGIEWLATTPFRNTALVGVDIINISFGDRGYVDGYYQAIANFCANTAIQVVACIGNNAASPLDGHWSPGNYDNVIGVGAATAYGCAAGYSAYGAVAQHRGRRKPDLIALGDQLEDPVSIFGGKVSGTSMASAIVAGACSLLIEDDVRLGTRAQDVPARLQGHLMAPPAGCANPHWYGGGVLRLQAPPGPPIPAGESTVEVEFDASGVIGEDSGVESGECGGGMLELLRTVEAASGRVTSLSCAVRVTMKVPERELGAVMRSLQPIADANPGRKSKSAPRV